MIQSSTLRRSIHYLIMCALTLVSILLLSEVMLRLFGQVPAQTLHTASEPIFDRIPGVFEPDQDVIIQPRVELSHHVFINSLGYRGRQLSQTKNGGTLRVLCLGDSFTFGDFVNNDETFPHYLQQIAEQRGMPVEVINAGVGGTTVVDQLYFLKKSMVMGPDIVILTYTENDIEDLERWEPMYVSFAKNRKLKSAPIIGTAYRLFRNTALFNLGLVVRDQYVQHLPAWMDAEGKARLDETIGGAREVLWRRYKEVLEEMHLCLDEHSVRFILAIFPSHYRLTRGLENGGPSDDRLHRVERIANEMGVSSINLFDPLEKSKLDRNQLYLLPYDGHPAKMAYAVVANAIFEYLEGIVGEAQNER